MELIKVARVPALTCTPETPLSEAVSQMAEHNASAIIVTSPQNVLLGIFSEHDNLVRVTHAGKNPSTALISEVMTSPVISARPELKIDEALAIMIRSHIRHLPVTDPTLHVIGIASMRSLMMRRISEQRGTLEMLGAYVTAGGPG